MCVSKETQPLKFGTYLFGPQIRSFSLARRRTLFGFHSSLSLFLSLPYLLARKYDLWNALRWGRDTWSQRRVWREKRAVERSSREGARNKDVRVLQQQAGPGNRRNTTIVPSRSRASFPPHKDTRKSTHAHAN